MAIHCFANGKKNGAEEEIETSFFYPSDLVNTKTTIPLRVGEERWIYTSVRATQLTLIDCYLPERPTGPRNFAHLVLTVLTKGANLDLKIASAIIHN